MHVEFFLKYVYFLSVHAFFEKSYDMKYPMLFIWVSSLVEK